MRGYSSHTSGLQNGGNAQKTVLRKAEKDPGSKSRLSLVNRKMSAPALYDTRLRKNYGQPSAAAFPLRGGGGPLLL